MSDKYEGSVLVFSQDIGDGRHTLNVQRLASGEVELRLFVNVEGSKYTGYDRAGFTLPETVWQEARKVTVGTAKAVSQAKVEKAEPKPRAKRETAASKVSAMEAEVGELKAMLATLLAKAS